MRLSVLFLLGVSLATAVILPTAANAESRFGGTSFANAASLTEAGWRNYVGQIRGRVLNRTGITMGGRPLQRAAFLTVDRQDSDNWWAGIYHDFAGVPGVPTTHIRLKGRIAGNKPGPVTVRIESSTDNWVGFVFDLPANSAWLEFNWPLSQAITQGRFDPASENFRLVAAYQQTAGPVWSSPGENTLYLAEFMVVTDL